MKSVIFFLGMKRKGKEEKEIIFTYKNLIITFVVVVDLSFINFIQIICDIIKKSGFFLYFMK